jgi:hypothetical protein
MRSRDARRVVAFAAQAALLLVVACSRNAAAPAASATATANATATGTASATATPGDTPVAGVTIKVGNWMVVTERFRAQVAAPQGVNIRSSPEVTPSNRTGSLAPGAIVEIEGRVPQGQEAEPGNGTLWYYVGTVGSTPQFIYGPAGTLTPLTGSATPQPSTSPSPPAASTTPSPTATP